MTSQVSEYFWIPSIAVHNFYYIVQNGNCLPRRALDLDCQHCWMPRPVYRLPYLSPLLLLTIYPPQSPCTSITTSFTLSPLANTSFCHSSSSATVTFGQVHSSGGF